MSVNKTMTDVAYDFLSRHKKQVEFLKLWDEVIKQFSIPEDKKRRKKSQFYSELLLDTRFASFENNRWDLRNRHRFDETHVDTQDIAFDDDDDELDVIGLDLPKGDDAFDN
ncbi:DNA-directed RNA polymerase subunit delta [Bulleidia extructa]|jgi:DNA-directed RNA polymerase, delta subunit